MDDRRRVVRHTTTAVLRRVIYDALTLAAREGLNEAGRTDRAVAAVLAVEPEVTTQVARVIVERLRPN